MNLFSTGFCAVRRLLPFARGVIFVLLLVLFKSQFCLSVSLIFMCPSTIKSTYGSKHVSGSKAPTKHFLAFGIWWYSVWAHLLPCWFLDCSPFVMFVKQGDELCLITLRLQLKLSRSRSHGNVERRQIGNWFRWCSFNVSCLVWQQLQPRSILSTLQWGPMRWQMLSKQP